MKPALRVILSIIIAVQAAAAPLSNFQVDVHHPIQEISQQVSTYFTAEALSISPSASYPTSSPRWSIPVLTIHFFGGLALFMQMIHVMHGLPAKSHVRNPFEKIEFFAMTNWFSNRPKKPNEDELLKDWFRKEFSDEAERLLQTYSLVTIRKFRSDYEIYSEVYQTWIRKFGLETALTFTPFGTMEDFERIYTVLREFGFDVTTETIFNRRLILEGIRLENLFPHKQELAEEASEGYQSVFLPHGMDKLVKESGIFNNDPLPEFDPRVRLLHIYPQISHLEHELWGEFRTRQFQLEKERPIVRDREKRLMAQIQEFDQEIVRFKDEIAARDPEFARKLEMPPRGNKFPQPGTIAEPGHVLTPLTLNQIIDGERVLYHLSRRTLGELRNIPSENLLMLVLGNPDPTTALNAALSYRNRKRRPMKVVIAGSVYGPWVPEGWEGGEPGEFKKILVTYGVPEKDIVVLKPGESTSEHMEHLKEWVAETGFPLKGLIVIQSLMVQQRIYSTAKKTFGFNDAQVESETPYFRDFYLAPPGRDLTEWSYELLILGVRDLNRLFTYADEGHILSSEVPTEATPHVLSNAKFLLSNPNVSSEGKKDILRWKNNIESRWNKRHRQESTQSYAADVAFIRNEYKRRTTDEGRHKIMLYLADQMLDRDPKRRIVARVAAGVILTEDKYDVDYMLSQGNQAQEVLELYRSGDAELKRIIWAILQSAVKKEGRKSNIRQSAEWILPQIQPPASNSSPITLVLHPIVSWPLSAAAYLGRVMQEGSHALGLWMSGVPWRDIQIDLNPEHPEIRLKGNQSIFDYPGAVFAGWLANWFFTAVFMALLPHAAGLPAVALIVLLVSNLTEAILNSVPYTVYYRGQVYYSDLQIVFAQSA